VIVVFGVLHHIPGLDGRLRLLRELSQKLRPGGVLALSFWQFAREKRFQNRIVSWSSLEQLGLPRVDSNQLEEGDFLLLWGPRDGSGPDGHGPFAVRFCHHANDSEVDQLITRLDLAVEDSYRSDGASNALNRYEVLRRSL
jgi:SAM-dependent methyltransferase